MNKQAVELLDPKEACGPHPGAAPAAKGRKSAPRRSRMTRSADVDVADMVQRAAVGDRDAWEMLVAQYRPLVLSIANRLRLTPEQSADVVQETWLQLFQHIGRIRDPARLPGWLATTARNNSLAIIRRNVKDRALLAAEHCSADVDDANPVVALVRSERQAALVRAVRRLPNRDQELLTLLCAAAPPAYREISRRLGIPIGSIGPTRRRALARLRAELLKDPRFDAPPVPAVLATRTARCSAVSARIGTLIGSTGTSIAVGRTATPKAQSRVPTRTQPVPPPSPGYRSAKSTVDCDRHHIRLAARGIEDNGRIVAGAT